MLSQGKRVLVAVAVAACGIATVGVPAQAATTTTQTASCVDKGGHRWTGRTVWGRVYTDKAGVRRVSNNYVAFTSAARDATTVDYTIKTYNANGSLVQTMGRQNQAVNFAGGRRYLSRNPRNPQSGPGKAKIVVRLGDGNDGRGNCTMTFVQPGAASRPTRSQPRPVTTGGIKSTAFVTGYTWYDNSPPGSAQISHPVLHKRAGGSGTYSNPITVAVGRTSKGPDFAYGTRFYLPKLKKYFIVEDVCGACHRHRSGVAYQLDIWVDGHHRGRSGANACASRITGKQTSIRKPRSGLPVSVGSVC